ncbi:hypothetical protein K435DRAFT_801035 [Dendrothele bispora CBS 962.96]|uniref:Uncharacterized protein n=1 Tax=Dendrothele bispora (strain CBS 962.96) TaxID=1314807 RepID=A0A4S8LRE1_DENBC|nr:hypothetical protein K435DRAFT_801035 [Dendrothele bispora CBS 962.96]
MTSIEAEAVPTTSVSTSPTPQDPTVSEEKVATLAQSDSDDKLAVSSRSSSPRPFRMYTRAQLIALYKSPLICLPIGMPELKDWFGIENEQNLSKKESEPTTPNTGRERRFRRDADEGDLSSRPSFRSSLSQPSQMGNFKHQSLRSSDHGDKEGQERLRNLSDKYDRDRLGLPLQGLRNKDRDLAPHLAGSSRLPAQSQGIAARRAEARESKKKTGETGSEDWRRDSRRSDRPENGRADRDERPRSLVRDSSRHRRDTSTSRREDSRKERDKGREEFRKDRDREDQRRERERENGDDDDSRRWRDDGRRDERMAVRQRERNRDKNAHESAWDNPGERRWAVEDRDDRTRRGGGKDKKSGAIEDNRDERRGDREKEKEPAWMDTYIPATGSGGILGGKGNDGELDGIQAWKKSVKEKEQKANKTAPAVSNDDSSTAPDAPQKLSDEPMDEIQRFKKMMELAQKAPNGASESVKATAPIEIGPVLKPQESKVDPAIVGAKVETSVNAMDSRSLLSLLTSSDPPRPVPLPSTGLESSSKHSINLPDIEHKPTTEPTSSQFTPPQGSRLLALGRASGRPSPLNNQSLVTPVLNGPLSSAQSPNSGFSNSPMSQSELAKLNPRPPSGFSPFEEQHNDATRRLSGDRSPFSADSGPWPDSVTQDSVAAGQAPGRGSRFAKFFDSKGKDVPVSAPNVPKSAALPGLISSSPVPSGRLESPLSSGPASGHEHRTVEDLFAKLNMNPMPRSSQVPNSAPVSNTSFSQPAQNHLQSLQQQLHSPNHLASNRVEPLYESRNFMPDGLVPGLRSAPPPRRSDGGSYPDPLDDAIMLNSQQRLSIQQQHQRGVDPLYSGALPAAFPQQQAGRNVGNVPIQQQHFRGGPSPVSNHQGTLHNVQQQRLPPGLANLGGRPPHDPSQQYLGMQGLNSQGLQGLHVNGPPQAQQFNNFGPGGNIGFSGPHAQLRNGPSAHQLPNSLTQQQLGALGHAGNLDVRGGNQAQFLALNGLNGLGGGGGMRNVNGGFNPQQNNAAQLQNPLLVMRQQQQQQQQQHQSQMLSPHMMQHLGPVQLQQQGPPIPNQPTTTQDLMALLLGGAHHRE